MDEVRRLTPEIAGALHAHAQDLARFFAAVTPVSVDVGVLERSDRVVVLPGWPLKRTRAPVSGPCELWTSPAIITRC